MEWIASLFKRTREVLFGVPGPGDAGFDAVKRALELRNGRMSDAMRRGAVEGAEEILESAFRKSKAWSVRRSGMRLYLKRANAFTKTTGTGAVRKTSSVKSFRIVPCRAATGESATSLVAPPGYDDLCRKAAKAIRDAVWKDAQSGGSPGSAIRLSWETPGADRDEGRVWVEIHIPAVGERFRLDVTDVVL